MGYRKTYSVINLRVKKKQPLTAVTRDLGISLNLKMVLYLENLCLTDKPRIFNPKPRVAPRRYGAVVPKLRRRKQSENKHLFPQEVYKSEA
ncbi:hypothetical protein FLAT13_05071 [Flavobacterium salmonis]|uniref:Uncharacterized protein n=1 Tax=Flavobacterium salmonis TaxID=2654844 RepID=A0A6V6ZD47_9FLAO|nr:hypothetical protein FLAT13_05071 [Flavobacterium salmonis]